MMDERQTSIRGRAAALALIAGYVYVFVWAIWLVIANGAVEAASGQILFLVLIPSIFAVAARRDESLFLPRTVTDEELDTDPGRPALASRLRHYALAATAFATGMVLLSVGARAIGIADALPVIGSPGVEIVIEFAVLWVVSFILDSLASEWLVRRYERSFEK
jgi:hypothetical protein